MTGNIYVATSGGKILACDTTRTNTLTCAIVVNSGGRFRGVALNPVTGYAWHSVLLHPTCFYPNFALFCSTVYYTDYGTDTIHHAGMDGSNPRTLVSTGLDDPWGITIDFQTSKLFWVDFWINKFETSNLQGGDRRKIASTVHPTGICVANGRIFWGELLSGALKSFDGNITTLYNGTHAIRGLTLVPDLNLPRNRTNHCEGHSCAKVCVLTPSSSRCLT